MLLFLHGFLFFFFLFVVVVCFPPHRHDAYTCVCVYMYTAVPEAPPENVTAEALSPTSISVQWQPPTSDRSNGLIIYYKIMCTEIGMSDSDAEPYRVENVTSHVLENLKRWTEYKIWVLAGTSVGDGPSSYPITVRTREDGKHKCY